MNNLRTRIDYRTAVRPSFKNGGPQVRVITNRIQEVHRRTVRWQATIEEAGQALLYQLNMTDWTVTSATVRKWKEGWLFILEMCSPTGKAMKSFAFGRTLNELNVEIWWKSHYRKWEWKNK